MSEAGGIRPRVSLIAQGGGDLPPPGLERKGRAVARPAVTTGSRPRPEATPIPARLNGRPVQVLLQPAHAASPPGPAPEGRASACRRLTQSAVQALWSWSPWAQPEPLADDGAAHYLALARRHLGQPPADAQLQSFAKAVMAREATHGFFRPPLAEMRAAYAALAQMLDLPSAGAGLLGRVIDALQAVNASPLHRISAAQALGRAITAPRLAPGHLDHLLRVLDQGRAADPHWCAMLVGLLAQVLGGSQMQPAQLHALVSEIFSPQRAGRGDAPVRRAQFKALVEVIAKCAQVQVPGHLWGQRTVTQVQALTQAQVTQVVRSILRPWRPEAMAVEQAMGEMVLVLDACLPEPARYQAHRWIVQALMQHFLDPRSQTAGVPYLPGMSDSSLDRLHDTTSAGCLGLAAALLAGIPGDTASRVGRLAAEAVEPALRASARLPSTRLRPMAHYQFAALLARLEVADISALLMLNQLPIHGLLAPVLGRICGLSLQQAGAWLAGVFGASSVLGARQPDLATIRGDQASQFREVLAMQFMVLCLGQMLAAGAAQPRLSRMALIGYEAGCALAKGRSLEGARSRVAAFMRSLGEAGFHPLQDDRKGALLAGLAMALRQRIPEAHALEWLLVETLPEPPPAPQASTGPAAAPSLARPARQAQVGLLREALALAHQPERILADPRFAGGDDAVEMLLLARAMPLASGADDLNHAVNGLASLQVPPRVMRQALARVAGQRGVELTPANFSRVHRAMLDLLQEASAKPAGPKDDSKREVRGWDEDEGAGEGLRFEQATPLLQFYEELRECSGLMFIFAGAEPDRAQLRASEPAIRHLLALLEVAQAEVRDRLKGPPFAQTRVLLEGTLENIRQPLQQALQGLSAHREKKAK